jgi:hypothetical protein
MSAGNSAFSCRSSSNSLTRRLGPDAGVGENFRFRALPTKVVFLPLSLLLGMGLSFRAGSKPAHTLIAQLIIADYPDEAAPVAIARFADPRNFVIAGGVM